MKKLNSAVLVGWFATNVEFIFDNSNNNHNSNNSNNAGVRPSHLRLRGTGS